MPRRSSSSKPPTLQDIAERCGVSKMSVSIALRGQTGISPETGERIRAMAEHLGYRSDQQHTARRLAARRHDQPFRNRVVAVFFPPSVAVGGFFTALFQGAQQALMAANHAVLCLPEAPAGGYTADALASIEQGEVDGTLVMTGHATMPLWRYDAVRSRPLVSFINDLGSGLVAWADEGLGARAATEHLLTLGHRHLLALTLADGSDGRGGMRFAGVEAAIEMAGLPPERHLHRLQVSYAGGWMQPPHFQADRVDDPAADDEHGRPLIEYLRAHPEVTALLALNDASARRAWRCLSRAGWSLPRDLSIIGFDDTDPLMDEQGVNRLASVRIPLVDVGRAAAGLLLRRLDSGDRSPEQVRLPTVFIPRSSVAPAPLRTGRP